MTLKGKKILVTGAHGFLGCFVINELLKKGCKRSDILTPTKSEYNFTDLKACREVVKGVDIIIHLAGQVGGIGYNREHPGELFYNNILMGVQLMDEARKAKVKKFVAIGTVCAYPKFTPVPFSEDNLWDGYPEETNAPYGLAKKMLLVQAQAYRDQYGFNAIYILPVNLYGPGDNFDPGSSHVIPALIKKAYEAKRDNKKYIEVWGSGMASREFLYVEDAAEAIVMATEKYNKDLPVNLGSGNEISISDLVGLIKHLVGFKGEIKWDTSRPDGQPRRCLDTERAFKEFGFRANTSFTEGLAKTIKWYINSLEN